MGKSLTSDDVAVLQTYVDAQDRVGYYSQLSDWGYKDYPDLAKEVVESSNLSGTMANAFLATTAANNSTPTTATLNVLDSETNNGQPIVLDTADGSISVQRYAPHGEMDTFSQIETQNGHFAITTVVNNPGGRAETVEISDI